MSQDPWNDWSQTWQAPASASPAVDIDQIERRVRRRLAWRRAQIVADLTACLVALALSAWLLTMHRPAGLAVGGAGLAFSLFGLFIALRGRRFSGATDRSVVSALDWEIAEVRADARRSVGGIAIAGAGVVFLIFCTTMIALEAGGLNPQRRWLTLLGVGVIAGSALWSAWLLLRRRARLRRLTALRDELAEDGA